MNRAQQGFTLIELIIVIVILGVLAATVAPNYIDLEDSAHRGVADGVLGTVNSVAAINFANNKMANTTNYIDAIDSANLTGNMSGLPTDWVSDAGGICYDSDASGTCTAADAYLITLNAAEDADGPATFTASW